MGFFYGQILGEKTVLLVLQTSLKVVRQMYQLNFALCAINVALGARVAGQEDRVSIHGFFTQTLCIYPVPTLRWSKIGPLYLSLLIFLQKQQKNERKPSYCTKLPLGVHYLCLLESLEHILCLFIF